MRQGAHDIVDFQGASQNEVAPGDVAVVNYIGELSTFDRGVDFWGWGLPKVDTDISLLCAANHGGSVGDLELNRLGGGAEVRWVEESTADEVDPGPRVPQHKRISGGPLKQGDAECEENLVELDGGVLAQEPGQGRREDNRLRVS